MRTSWLMMLPVCLGLAGSHAGAAAAPAVAGLDPLPYQRVVDRADWTAADGSRFAFCLLGREDEARARVVAVYRRTAAGWTRVFLDRDRGTRPWAIRLAELDGDRLPEVMVGVHKRTRFDPVPRNRLFVFDWTDKEVLFPKWLGSRLGLPFADFAATAGADGRDRLLTWGWGPWGAALTRCYAWNGFGFDLDGSGCAAGPRDGTGSQDGAGPRGGARPHDGREERCE